MGDLRRHWSCHSSDTRVQMHVRTKSRWTSKRAESPSGRKIESFVVAVAFTLCLHTKCEGNIRNQGKLPFPCLDGRIRELDWRFCQVTMVVSVVVEFSSHTFGYLLNCFLLFFFFFYTFLYSGVQGFDPTEN